MEAEISRLRIELKETLEFSKRFSEDTVSCPECDKEIHKKAFLRHRTVKAANCPGLNPKLLISNWDIRLFL